MICCEHQGHASWSLFFLSPTNPPVAGILDPRPTTVPVTYLGPLPVTYTVIYAYYFFIFLVSSDIFMVPISHHTIDWDSPIEQKFCIPLVWLFTSATEPAGRMVFLDCPLRWRVFPVLDCWVAMVLLKDFIGTSSVYISTPK